MIGYNTLGTNGRLGNQMFQYASLRGIADKHGYDFCIPPEDHPTYADYALFLTFKMDGIKTGLVNGDTVSESGYEFDENLFNTCPDNVNIDGYYQTEKYFIFKNKKKMPFFFNYLTYKPNTDILTESQQYRLCLDLLDEGYSVYCSDSSLKDQCDSRIIYEQPNEEIFAIKLWLDMID